jgi:hypothetical protein
MDRIEVICPKCTGNKTIRGFGHIAGGVCFRCSGNGTILVTPEKAPEYEPVRVQPVIPTAVIGTLGKCEIYPDRIEAMGRHGGLPVYFERTDRGVRVTSICQGLLYRRAEVVRELTAWATA